MESEVEVFVVKVWVGKTREETASYPFPIPIFPPHPPFFNVGRFFVEALLV